MSDHNRDIEHFLNRLVTQGREEAKHNFRMEQKADEALDLLHAIADVLTAPVSSPQLKSLSMLFGSNQT